MDQYISAINGLRDFLTGNMISKEEIQERFNQLPTQQDVQRLQTSVEEIAKHLQRNQGSERMKHWMRNAARKLSIDSKV